MLKSIEATAGETETATLTNEAEASVVDRAVTGDKLLQRLGKYRQELHVLGEMGATIACDISVTRTELGYEPEIELFEGMRRSIRWCIEQGVEL